MITNRRNVHLRGDGDIPNRHPVQPLFAKKLFSDIKNARLRVLRGIIHTSDVSNSCLNSKRSQATFERSNFTRSSEPARRGRTSRQWRAKAAYFECRRRFA